MSDNQNMGFGKFVPGFDFLQNLAKGASQSLPQMPNLANWVAPTLNVEELEKRIGEMKAVHFWLDQNSKALGATIQALEVQKMTLATLKGMNVAMGDITNALKLKTTEAMTGAMSGALKKGAEAGASPQGGAVDSDSATNAAPSEPVNAGATSSAKSKSGRSSAKQADVPVTANVIDPMQWWGSLTQQFQQIAATAMKDVATQTAMDAAKTMATGVAKEAFKTATGVASGGASGVASGVAKRAAKKAPAKRAKKKGGA
jgi:hypothetical protein